LRPPVLLIGLLARPLYRPMFSRSDERLATEHEEKLLTDLHTLLPFLFNEMDGRTVPGDRANFPPPFDYAVVTIDVSDLFLRFTRGRDHLAVQVAPKSSPNNFHELSTVLNSLEICALKRGTISGLHQAGALLRTHMDALIQAFSEDQYPLTRARLHETYAHDEVIRRQQETEINRRLYPQP
jgi:hypothetical protein